MSIRTIIAGALLFCATASSNAAGRYADLEKDVNLIICNDLGRNGAYDQKNVAELMGTVADEVGPDAVLALGDTHHFLGIQSVSDPLWMTNYELIYSHPELQIEWYPILGNHEYRGNTDAVIAYSSISRRWDMPARYYTRTFSNNGTKVKVVFIDTTPLIDKYRTESDKYPDARLQDIDSQLKWLDNELSQTDGADWVVVAGHHPIYAQTKKEIEEQKDMQKRIAPILRKHGVDVYICGHIHNFQHIREAESDIDFIVNSSASLSRKDVKPIDGTQFYNGDEGFSLLNADKANLNIYLIDKAGKIIHTVSRKK